MAEEAKKKGNEAFTAKDYPTAIKHFTDAIALDPSNHVLFSNRSACFTSIQKFKEALEDAEMTVKLKSDWARGYGRKGAALYGMRKYEEAIEAYEAGLKIEPDNAALKKGLDDAEGAVGGDVFGNMFKGDIWGKLRAHPKTAAYCHQPDFVELVNKLQNNPSSLTTNLGDPRVAAVLGVLLGVDIQNAPGAGGFGGGGSHSGSSSPKPMETDEKKTTPSSSSSSSKEKEKEKEPVKELPENKKKALEEKEKGTAAYKKKDFETALSHYSSAHEADPEDISHLTNKAAVYFEMSKYDECIKECNTAIEEGRKVYADYKIIARAFARIGNAYAKQDKYKEAVDAYNKSLTEHRTAEVLTSLQKVEKLKKEKEEKDYINPEIAKREKETGNEYFKKQQYPEAIKAYSEAIKRNPSDAVPLSNRAACYTKLGEFPSAIKDCDDSLKIDPNYIKSYIRKGNCQFFMKDYHKCLETYEKGLKIDSNNAELQEGLRKTYMAINRGNDEQTDEQRIQQAQNDPEIRQILSDPVMRQILNDMGSDPKAAADHMRNPVISAKIQKLVAAGIVKVG